MTGHKVDQLMSALRSAPQGLTTRQVVEKIGSTNIDTVSARLSRLAAYGKIDRQIQRGPSGYVPTRWYLWRMKSNAQD